MELVFLKRATAAGAKGKTRASFKDGNVQLSKGSNEAFDLENSFLYGRVALEKIESDLQTVKNFYLVEETDPEKIEKDIDVVKMFMDKNNGARRFTFAALTPYFTPKENAERKTIYFNIQRREVNGLKVLQFTLDEN